MKNLKDKLKTHKKTKWTSVLSRAEADTFKILSELGERIEYNGFTVEHSECLLCGERLKLGFKSKMNCFVPRLCKCTRDGTYLLTAAKLASIFDDAEIIEEILTEIRSKKTRKFVNTRSFWRDQGLPEDQIDEKISEIQKTRSEKSSASKKGSRSHSVRCKEYWLKLGFSESDAEKQVAEIQTTNTLEIYTVKYGETKGVDEFKKRQEKRLKTLADKPQDEINAINQSKRVTVDRMIAKYGETEGKKRYFEWKNKVIRNISNRMSASWESLEYFQGCFDILMNNKIDFYAGNNGNREFHQFDGNRHYLFDFVIPELKLAIEYHGVAFHPNPNWSAEQWDEWICPFRKKKAQEIREFDEYKKSLLEARGYTVIEIWSDERNNFNLEELLERRINANNNENG